MRRYCVRERPWSIPHHVWFWRLTLLFLAVLGYTLGDGTPAGAADQPSKGGTIVWAVHESMPHFDIHIEGSYILAQPVGPLYNSLLTFDLYNKEKIVGALAERWDLPLMASRSPSRYARASSFTTGRISPVPMPNIALTRWPIRSAPV